MFNNLYLFTAEIAESAEMTLETLGLKVNQETEEIEPTRSFVLRV
ncbi:MAG: hypothetical protein WBC40_01725 [Halobacteriota archaeon]